SRLRSTRASRRPWPRRSPRQPAATASPAAEDARAGGAQHASPVCAHAWAGGAPAQHAPPACAHGFLTGAQLVTVPIMRAAFASRFNDADPLTALTVGEQPEPTHPADDWVTVQLR